MTVKVSSSIRIELHTLRYKVRLAVNTTAQSIQSSSSSSWSSSSLYWFAQSSTRMWFLPRCMKCRRGLAMRILSVRLSVRLSVCHTRDPWQNGRKIGPDFYTIRKNIYPSFLRKRMVGGGRPILREILGQPTPVGTKLSIFN